MLLLALLAYLTVGALIARQACPLSFPFGHNAIVVTLLWPWPWPVAAALVHWLTGEWPRWTPPL